MLKGSKQTWESNLKNKIGHIGKKHSDETKLKIKDSIMEFLIKKGFIQDVYVSMKQFKRKYGYSYPMMSAGEFLSYSVSDERFESIWLDWEERAFAPGNEFKPWLKKFDFAKGVVEDNIEWRPLYEKHMKESLYKPESEESRKQRLDAIERNKIREEEWLKEQAEYEKQHELNLKAEKEAKLKEAF